LPENIPHVGDVLLFAYESTGVETFFRDLRDPEHRSRRVFAFHMPAESFWACRTKNRYTGVEEA
jgi:type I restriction enzyme R subunit